MRIVLVGTGWLPLDPGAGGIENLVRSWADALAPAHDVVLWSVGTERPSCRSDRFVHLHSSTIDELRADLRSTSYDVAHFHNRPTWAASVPGGVVTLHNDLDACATGPSGAVATPEAILDALRRVPTSVVSRSLGATVAGQVEGSFDPIVTPPALDAAFLALAQPRPHPRNEPPTVLVPVRLLPKKGIQLALDVARSDELPPCTFQFTRFLSPYPSPMPDQQRLIAAVEATPRAELVDPPSSRAEMADLLAGADVVLVPSVWPEPFGLVSIEAQSVGTPVVVTDRGGLPETLARGSSPVDATVPGLVEGIRTALLAPACPGEAMREIQERYGAANVVRRLEELYRTVDRP